MKAWNAFGNLCILLPVRLQFKHGTTWVVSFVNCHWRNWFDVLPLLMLIPYTGISLLLQKFQTSGYAWVWAKKDMNLPWFILYCSFIMWFKGQNYLCFVLLWDNGVQHCVLLKVNSLSHSVPPAAEVTEKNVIGIQCCLTHFS